jgi:serine/threonine protein kinase
MPHFSVFTSPEEKQKYIDDILLGFHHLLMGLKLFKDNGIVHHDLKPGNIVFNPTTKQMMYIDFGFTTFKEIIKELCRKSDYEWTKYHWSWPPQCRFLNKDKFEELFEFPITAMDSTEFAELYNVVINKHTFDVAFAYTNNKNVDSVPNDDFKVKFIYYFITNIDLYIQKCEEDSEKYNYEQFLNSVIDSFDIYGLGITFQYVIGHMKKNGIIDPETYSTLFMFFGRMYNMNIFFRETSIDVLVDEYENVLLQCGVLSRLNKVFENHKLVDNMSTFEAEILDILRHDEGIEEVKLTEDLKRKAFEDPEPIETKRQKTGSYTTVEGGKTRTSGRNRHRTRRANIVKKVHVTKKKYRKHRFSRKKT